MAKINKTKAKPCIRNIDSIYNNIVKEVTGINKVPNNISSGFEELDAITKGFNKGEIVIIGARPGMGKTSFLLSVLTHISIEKKIPSAYFSLDLTSERILKGLLVSYLEKPAEEIAEMIKKNKLPEKLITSIKKAPVFFEDTPYISVQGIKEKLKYLVKEKGVEIIFIDYLQLLAYNRNSYNSREFEIGAILRELKNTAKEYNIAVIITSQLSRAVETRGGCRRPMLSDLRESGSIEQDADKVIFIYRAEYYKLIEDENGCETKGVAEIIVAKNKFGKMAECYLNFIENFGKYKSFENTSYWGELNIKEINKEEVF